MCTNTGGNIIHLLPRHITCELRQCACACDGWMNGDGGGETEYVYIFGPQTGRRSNRHHTHNTRRNSHNVLEIIKSCNASKCYKEKDKRDFRCENVLCGTMNCRIGKNGVKAVMPITYIISFPQWIGFCGHIVFPKPSSPPCAHFSTHVIFIVHFAVSPASMGLLTLLAVQSDGDGVRSHQVFISVDFVFFSLSSSFFFVLLRREGSSVSACHRWHPYCLGFANLEDCELMRQVLRINYEYERWCDNGQNINGLRGPMNPDALMRSSGGAWLVHIHSFAGERITIHKVRKRLFQSAALRWQQGSDPSKFLPNLRLKKS